ncbi:MAG: Gfo/Idh/MocA family oxidoreductase [Candidatus Binataceae bacterium]|nr:Gfo/Idh/MocA family oxidoreductase [Candidatus Binataceae bacterium]
MARLHLGIAGVGIGALQILPDLRRIADKVEIAALADLRHDNMEYFAAQYGKAIPMYDEVAPMCADRKVDAVWVATPNRFHAEHVIAAADRGKHVICEKPMAVTLAQCEAMVQAIERNGVKYVQGHSKVYDAPIQKMGEILAAGEKNELGRVIHIETWNWNDWMIRSLLADEVETRLGTGVVFRQGPHQIDTVRYLGGGVVRSVKAIAGRWHPPFPNGEGNYTALLEFENGVAATLVFDGYGYFDSTELTWGIGEAGKLHRNSESIIGRERPPGPISTDEKYARVRAGNPYGYGRGGGWIADAPQRQPFYGLTIVSCERGVMRQSQDGIYIYGEQGRREVTLPPSIGRASELLELYQAIEDDRPTAMDARWGMATTEVCLAILESTQQRAEIRLSHQSASPLELRSRNSTPQIAN